MDKFFKTPAVAFLYDLLQYRFPEHKILFDSVKHELQNIILPDTPPMTSEWFVQNIHLISDFKDCDNEIIITWNIEKILNTNPKCFTIESHSVKYLLNSYSKDCPFLEIANHPFEHKGKYIILAKTPLTGDSITIIDGNHRVLENLHSPHKFLKCILLNEKEILEFLQPNSRKLFEIMLYIKQFI